MRILFWSEAFPPSIGGVEILASNFLDALSQRGNEIVIIAPRDPNTTADNFHGVPIHRLPFQSVLESHEVDRFATLLLQLRQIKREFRPDLIHIFHPGAGLFFHMQTTEAFPTPELVTLHQHLPDRQTRHDQLYGRMLRHATWVTACSRAVMGITRQQIPEISEHSSIIHNGIALAPLAPAPFDFAAPQILCTGRLVYQKGFDVALDAFVNVLENFPSARLQIAGDGPMRDELEIRAHQLGIARAVEFLGWVEPEKMPALLNGATLVVVPSRAEPFGLVALQAAQMGRPVIATRVGGLPEVVVDGETGVLVEKENSTALANAITALLQDPTRAQEMGKCARRRAIEQFGWERFVDAYAALYERLSA